jgi:hypothetical protein
VKSVTQREEALVIARNTDTLTVSIRGYNGTVANTFDTNDFVRLNVTAPNHQRIIDHLNELAKQEEIDRTAIANFSSVAAGKGASLVGIEDPLGYFTGANVEAALLELKQTIPAVNLNLYFGDGSDGALSVASGTTTLDAGGLPILIKQYTTVNIASGATLALTNVPAEGCILVLYTTGNCTIAGKIDLKGKGSAGGSTGAITRASGGSTSRNGADGSRHSNAFQGFGAGGGGTGITGSSRAAASGGASGANHEAAGTNSAGATTTGGSGDVTAAGATGGVAASNYMVMILSRYGLPVNPGAGGGEGGAAVEVSAYTSGTFSATPGAGGTGGGGLLVGCRGTLSFTGEIDLRANNGGNASTALGSGTGESVAGGGGAGAGGVGLLLGKTVTNSGTPTLTAATGGTSSSISSSGSTQIIATSPGVSGPAGVLRVLKLIEISDYL